MLLTTGAGAETSTSARAKKVSISLGSPVSSVYRHVIRRSSLTTVLFIVLRECCSPGYLDNLPVFSGIAVAAFESVNDTTSEFAYVDTNLTSQLTLWSPGECVCDVTGTLLPR